MPKRKSGELSQLSAEYLSNRPKAERSPLGQFLTPQSLRERLLDQVPLQKGMKILDPGVGTGEFLKSCLARETDLDLHGWDIDEQVLKVAKQLVPTATFNQRSALDFPQQQNLYSSPDEGYESFDLVIGNPPYFEMKGISPDLRSNYADVIAGRPNIFSLFFKVGMEALKPGGHLAYVVPPSMNNGAYFERLRSYLLSQGEITFLEIFRDPRMFEDVLTAVQIIVIRKGGTGKKFTVDLGKASDSPKSRVIFTDSPTSLKKKFKNKDSLWNLGYIAKTGTVVWNTRKEQLRRKQGVDTVPLLWAHNISADSRHTVLNFEHQKKPQFITGVPALLGPAIIVNRITGTVGSGTLRCALIADGERFVGENHVNVIQPRPESPQLVSFDKLLDRLRDPDVTKAVQILTGNTQLSATELTYWTPI